MKEALKLALEALTIQSDRVTEIGKQREAITAIKAALAKDETSSSRGSKEPVALVIDGVLVKSELPKKYTGHLYTTQPQPEERNFCPRCGKRTADLTVIHTCTPPQENT